jgi:mannose-6-phosphate isomerase-like protein (cupin superfamily)
MDMINNSFYDSRIVFKPWGYEYVIYRYKKILSITFLHINKNKRTSLHCHPKKKTGFVLLDGKALIQLGLWKSEQKVFNSPSKLMIRTGLFHSIKCISKKPLLALEFETPSNKNDLVRFNDKYGREKKSYEKGKKISKNNLNLIKLKNFKGGQKYEFGKTRVSLESHKNFKKLIKEKNSVIFAIINGNVSNKKNQKVLSPGDIIRTGTLKKLALKFKIKNKLNLLKISYDKKL